MESIVKKYQQKFRRIKEEMSRWEELQSLLIAQFSNASSIIQRLQVIQDSRNFGALRCVEGIEGAVLAKQMDSLQTVLISINNTMKEFRGIVSSLEKAVRDSKQLIKVGSARLTAKQLKHRIGVKPTLADCLEGLRLLEEMHQSEYLLKLSMVSALPALALKPSASDDLGALQQLLVDQPNLPREEGNEIITGAFCNTYMTLYLLKKLLEVFDMADCAYMRPARRRTLKGLEADSQLFFICRTQVDVLASLSP